MATLPTDKATVARRLASADNPHEEAARLRKVMLLVPVLAQVGYTSDELRSIIESRWSGQRDVDRVNRRMKEVIEAAGVNPPSMETWEAAVEHLAYTERIANVADDPDWEAF